MMNLKSNRHKSKLYDLIYTFNYTSEYLDDIFNIDNPEIEKHFPDEYSTELQLNKANTSDRQRHFFPSSLDSNIKVICGDFHTSVYDKRDDFGFPFVNFPWLSGDVPRLPSYGVYNSQLVRFARCCTSLLDFNSKIHKLLPNCWHRATYITSFEKHLESSSGHTMSFYLNLLK